MDGSLNLPLVGKLTVEGMTLEQAGAAIASQYQPEFPISPNIKRSLTLGAVASIFLGLGAAFILEKNETIDGRL